MIYNTRSPKSQMKPPSFLQEIIASNNEVFKGFESNITVRLRRLCNATPETADSTVIVNQNVGSSILTLELQANKSDL
jgi:hypothetical protein